MKAFLLALFMTGSGLFAQNVGIGTVAPEGALDVNTMQATAQATTTAGAFAYGAEIGDLVLTHRHGPFVAGFGYAASLIDFRSTNVFGDHASLAHILSVVDPNGGSGWSGGLAFMTSPGGGTNPAGRRTTGAAPVTRMLIDHQGRVGIGTTVPAYTLEVNGTWGYGNASGGFRSRTETRDAAGLQGNAGAQSGFFETSNPAPAAQWPVGAASWWHMLDVRHANHANNYAMQFAGSFFDQDLYFRKTNNNPNQPWQRVMMANQGWLTTGNAGTTPAANFLGTTDNQGLVLRTNNAERVRVSNTGLVGIGATNPQVLLSVGGDGVNVYATSAWVENNLHVQGNETLTQGGRGRLRIGTAWQYVGLYAEQSSTGVNNDLVLGASSDLVRVGQSATTQNLRVAGVGFGGAFLSRTVTEAIGPGTGADNQLHTMQCPAGYAVISVQIRATTYLDGAAACGCVELPGLLNDAASFWQISNFGGLNADNAVHTCDCPANHVMTGLRAYATTYWDFNLALRCTPLTGTATTSPGLLTTFGPNIGTDDEYHAVVAPYGTVGTGLWIQASSYLDGELRFRSRGITRN